MSTRTLTIVAIVLLFIVLCWNTWNTFSIRNVQKQAVNLDVSTNSNLLRFFIGIAIIGVIALVGFTVWNWYNLNHLRNVSAPIANLNDRNYWELYYKIQFQTTAFVVAIALISFFGYTTIKDAKSDVRSEMQSALKSQNDSIAQNKHQFDQLSSKYTALSEAYPALANMANNTKNSFGELQNEFKKLSEKDILKQPIYIVNISYTRTDQNLETNWSEQIGGFEFPFAKMMTVNNEKLPEFKSPPTVLVFASPDEDNNQMTPQAELRAVTNTSAYIYLGGLGKFNFTCFITAKP